MNPRAGRYMPWAIALLLALGGHLLLAANMRQWHAQLLPATPSATLLIELPPLPEVQAPPTATEAEPLPQTTVETAPPKPVVHAAIALKTPVKRPDQTPSAVPPAPPKAPAPPRQTATATTTPGPVTAVARTTARAPNQALITWQNQLLGHLARFKRYPDSARRRGVQGTNTVHLLIDKSGHVTSVTLSSTSGSAALDRATLQLIRRAEPLPPPPAELLEEGHVQVAAPISYSLDH